VLHPVLAVLAAAYFTWMAISTLRRKPDSLAGRIAMFALILTLAQLGVGVINLALLAPVAMQIIHLLMANLVWLSLVLLTAERRAA